MLLGVLVLLVFVVVADPNKHLQNLPMEYLPGVKIRMGDEGKELSAFHDIVFVRLLVAFEFEDDIYDQLDEEDLEQIEAQLVPIGDPRILRVLLLQPHDVGHEVGSDRQEVLYGFRLHVLEEEGELHRLLREVLELIKFHVDRLVLGGRQIEKSVLVAREEVFVDGVVHASLVVVFDEVVEAYFLGV